MKQYTALLVYVLCNCGPLSAVKLPIDCSFYKTFPDARVSTRAAKRLREELDKVDLAEPEKQVYKMADDQPWRMTFSGSSMISVRGAYFVLIERDGQAMSLNFKLDLCLY